MTEEYVLCTICDEPDIHDWFWSLTLHGARFCEECEKLAHFRDDDWWFTELGRSIRRFAQHAEIDALVVVATREADMLPVESWAPFNAALRRLAELAKEEKR